MNTTAYVNGRFLPPVLDHELPHFAGHRVTGTLLAPAPLPRQPPPSNKPVDRMLSSPGYASDPARAEADVPEALRERPQWVCWRYVERDGRPTKCPINPTKGGPASSTDPATWGTLEQATAAYHRSSDLAGVGYVFAADDPFCGVDLDDCIDSVTGALKPWAQEIVEQLDSYAEISPSGNGVKIFLNASKPGRRCKTGYEDGAVEMYDRSRFFTVTGSRLPDRPGDVEKRQKAIDAVYDLVFGKPATPQLPTTPPPPSDRQVRLEDDEILRLACGSRRSGAKFSALWAGRWNDDFNSHSEADSSLVFTLTFYTKDVTQIDRIFRRSGLMRGKWDEQHGEQTYGQMTIAKAMATVTGQYQPRKSSKNGTKKAAPPPPAPIHNRPNILIDTEEHRVVRETIAALSVDPDIYQRGGILVRVLRSSHPQDGIARASDWATISALPPANLRERMTRSATFVKFDRQGEEMPAHPAVWLVSAVDARGEWPGIRSLTGVSDAPVLRADGSIWQKPGYDPVTGVLYDPATTFPCIPDGINIDDADAAMTDLLDVVCDFRFESEEHKAAWLAGLLTPLARFAFDGSTPLFLIDANVRGAGKGLLAQTIGWIVLGREMPVGSYAHDSDELRKKITAIAIAGDRMILFDNVEGPFGNDALDRALTGTRWKDRILGKSQEIELPLIPSWYATGNNVQVAADTTRRVIHIRLDVLDEHPEDRTGFKHPNLLAWIAGNRGHLLMRAITILAAYCRAGRPSQKLTPFGSFEGWSSIVREAVVWAGLPDPCLTRTRLVESADTTTDALSQLINAWRRYDALNRGFVLSGLLNTLYPPQRESAPRDDASNALRTALENLVGCPPGKAPTARQVGNRMRRFRRRVVAGMFLDTDATRDEHGKVWRLHIPGGGR